MPNEPEQPINPLAIIGALVTYTIGLAIGFALTVGFLALALNTIGDFGLSLSNLIGLSLVFTASGLASQNRS